MAKFHVVPLIRNKKDGSNQKEQVFLQGVIEGIIGLPERLKAIESSIAGITGKNIDKNGTSHFVTKEDLADYATKSDLDDVLKRAKTYADLVSAKVVTLADGTNINTVTKTGIYYKPKGVTVSNLPPYNTINQSGILIVINGSDNRLLQKFISMDLTVYEYERIPLYPLTNPIKWNTWSYNT